MKASAGRDGKDATRKADKGQEYGHTNEVEMETCRPGLRVSEN